MVVVEKSYSHVGKLRRGNAAPFGAPAADEGTLLSLQDTGVVP